MKTPPRKQVIEFLEHSNFIESEYSPEALDDAIEAWNYVFNEAFSINMLLSIHKILMKRLRPDMAGRFRKCDVWIGGERKKFIHESKFKEDLEKMFEEIDINITNANDFRRTFKRNKNIKNSEGFFDWANSRTRHWHVYFEKIHPFEDGNGRVGRILYNLHRLRLGLPLHIIHEGDEQLNYYKWFQNPIKNI